MNGIAHYGTFLFAGILLNLTPGNDTLYILSQSIGRGRKAGVYSALGIGTGTIIHTLFAAFGLSLVISQSILLFSVMKYLGAAYLVVLGISMMRTNAAIISDGDSGSMRAGHAKTYRDAVLTNVFNPKVALFFIAFLPQFIDPSYRHAFVPFLALGLTFTFTGTLWCLCLASFASVLAEQLKRRPTFSSLLNKLSGLVLVGLGVRLAFAQSK